MRISPKRQSNLDRMFGTIVEFKKENNGNSPSIREIMSKTEIGSTSYVLRGLKVLEDQGKIKFLGVRNITIVGSTWSMN